MINISLKLIKDSNFYVYQLEKIEIHCIIYSSELMQIRGQSFPYDVCRIFTESATKTLASGLVSDTVKYCSQADYSLHQNINRSESKCPLAINPNYQYL